MNIDPVTEARQLFAKMDSRTRRALARRDDRCLDFWLDGLSRAVRDEVLILCDRYSDDCAQRR